MHQVMMTVTALVAFGAMVVATAQAENQTPSPPTASGPVKQQTASQTAHPSQAKRASYNECEKKARDAGLVHGQAGAGCYIWQCMGLLTQARKLHKC
jgi:hypothetical protein